VKLTIDDKETKQAVNAALNHIGEAKDEKDSAVITVRNHQKHMTRAHEMDTND